MPAKKYEKSHLQSLLPIIISPITCHYELENLFLIITVFDDFWESVK